MIAGRLTDAGVDAVAICFLHSYANAEHEKRCAAIIAKHLPAATVTTSAEVLPEFREYERFSTTALNAYVAPRMRRYLGRSARQAGRVRHDSAAGDHDVERRLSSCRARRGDARAVDAVGAGGRRYRGRACRLRGRLSRSHHLRHGRDLHRRVPRARRHVRHDDRRSRRCVSDQDPADRHQFNRRRRRQHRGAGLGRLSHGRSALGRRSARSRLLRPRRHRADNHRCQRGAGTPWASTQPLGGEIALDRRQPRKAVTELAA